MEPAKDAKDAKKETLRQIARFTQRGNFLRRLRGAFAFFIAVRWFRGVTTALSLSSLRLAERGTRFYKLQNQTCHFPKSSCAAVYWRAGHFTIDPNPRGVGIQPGTLPWIPACARDA